MAQASPSPNPLVAPEPSTLRRQRNRELAGFSPILDSEHVLAELRKTIRDGHISLDSMLQHIAEASQVVTGANGTAIAIRHDNSVICQARAGDMAPDLGSKLDAHSGISERCLRMGVAMRCYDTNDDTRVDAKVCHRLGLRSLAVVPVGRKPVTGILEAFSGLPNDFGDTDMKVLEQLAELVIAAQRRSAESEAQRLREKLSKRTLQSWSKRNLILAAPTVLVLVVWLFFREKPEVTHSSATPVQLVTQSIASPVETTSSAVVLQPDASAALRVWSTPPNVRFGLVMASKKEKAKPSEGVIVRNVGAAPASDSKKAPSAPENLAMPAPPVLATMSASSETALRGLLSAPTDLPHAAIRVSQGLSGGTLERRVDPTYPPEAHARRLEGHVLLQAVVREDGTVSDLKVITGEPLLAQAAMEAVSQWRYRPFRLNGEPVRMKTQITIIFKLP
jgi:TonB family protein